MERKRQKEAVGRVEKITVKYEGVPERKELVMNKNISTPYDCAKRKLLENVVMCFFIVRLIFRFKRNDHETVCCQFDQRRDVVAHASSSAGFVPARFLTFYGPATGSSQQSVLAKL